MAETVKGNSIHTSCFTISLKKPQLPGVAVVEEEGIVVVLAGM